MINFLRRHRAISILGYDMLMAFISVHLAFFMRLGDSFFLDFSDYLSSLLLFPMVALATHLVFNTHKAVWRYSSINDLLAIAKTSACAVLSYVTLLFLINRLDTMPRSVFLIHAIVYIFMLGGSRLLYRMICEKNFSLSQPVDLSKRIPLILFGLNKQAELFIRYLQNKKDDQHIIVAIIDTKGDHAGSRIFNIPIFSHSCSFQHVLHQLHKKAIYPQKIIITNEHEGGGVVRNLLAEADKHGITLARLPRLIDFHSANGADLELRPIVLEDLLGRPQQVLDRLAMRQLVQGKRILITGCGGTIGSELTRQISAFGPAHISLLEQSEYNLYSIDHEVGSHFPQLSKSTLLADIRDKKRLHHIFKEERPDIVFHAAAIKHVPIAEANTIETVYTNVLGTQYIADCCREFRVNTMVMISTDKAVNPTSMLGKTKRLAEHYIEHLASDEKTSTHFVTVRFGNVIGSSGSVIPLFEKQIKQGGPVTVTHPDMTRYFMTVREAVELILQASAQDHEAVEQISTIYVLDMGDPVRIEDLAIQMIRMSGLKHGEDIAISYTGLRPGEKMHEELFYEKEKQIPTKHKNIMIASPIPTEKMNLTHMMALLEKAVLASDANKLDSILSELMDVVNGSDDVLAATHEDEEVLMV